MNCSYCNTPLSPRIARYSFYKYNMPLCFKHQYWFKHALNEDYNTEEALLLYVRLKELGAKPILNKFDGHKTIDIAIEEASIHIEVDGAHHNLNPAQAFSDLRRTIHDLEMGITTIRIPNSLVWDNLIGLTNQLIRIIESRKCCPRVVKNRKKNLI